MKESSEENKICVRFKHPENEDEAFQIFRVLEDRGDRLLVEPLQGFKDWEIRPTFVYQKSDVEVIQK